MSVQTQGDMKAVFMTQYKKANFGNIQTPKSKDLMFGHGDEVPAAWLTL